MNKYLRVAIVVAFFVYFMLPVVAINYPTYQSPYSSAPTTNNTASEPRENTYGGYSTVATGGTTTYGEGSVIDEEATIQSRAGARRTVGGEGSGQSGNAGTGGEGSPVGSPLVMLLFAAMAAVVVYLRKRKNLVTE